MAELSWHIVTKNQDNLEKAKKLAHLIAEHLPTPTTVSKVEKYHKFPNSYSLVLTTHVEKPEANKDALYLMVQLANQIVDGWLVYFRDDADDIEMFFNQNSSSRYTVLNFNVIAWVHLQWAG